MPVKKRNRAPNNNKSGDFKQPQPKVSVPVPAAVAVPVVPAPVAVTVQAERLDPEEVARFVKNAGRDSSCQIVRHLAIFRCILFLQLVHVSCNVCLLGKRTSLKSKES
jgi:hypothetical protein